MLLGLCVFGIIYGRIQTARRTVGSFDPVARLVHGLSDPIARLSGGSIDAMSDFSYGLLHARRLTAENRRMRELLNAAALYTETTNRLTQELGDLRVLQGLPKLGKTPVVTDIVGYAPYENRLTLGVGLDKGIGVGMPVECAQGLVGTVQMVDAHRCQVQLLSSAGLTLGAIDLDRNPPPEGLLNGESTSKLGLVFLDPEAPVSIGDRIYTSGHSEHIPAGILIGKVIARDFNPEFGTRRATVFPAVQIGNIREVVILK